MTTTANTSRSTQVFRIYIKAKPEDLWQAIVDPEWNQRYGYAAPQFYELRPGGRFYSTASEDMRKASAEMGWPCPDMIVDGKILEADPPHKLVQTWRMLMDPTTAAEPMTTLTWVITPSQGGSKLTLTHDVSNAPATGHMVSGALGEDAGQGGGGWS